jgi:hypothetical protein
MQKFPLGGSAVGSNKSGSNMGLANFHQLKAGVSVLS